MPVLSKDLREKHPSESRKYTINFGPLLGSGETLSGTPTVSATPSGLTLGSPTINSSTVTDPVDGSTCAANEGVQVQVSSGTSGVEYILTVTATQSTNTLVSQHRLLVKAAANE